MALASADDWRTWTEQIKVHGPNATEAERCVYSEALKLASIPTISKGASKADIEEVVHEVIVKTWNPLSEAPFPKSLMATALKRGFIDRFRKNKTAERLAVALETANPSHHDMVTGFEAKQDVDRWKTYLKTTLTSRDFDIFFAKVELGHSGKQLAETFGTTVNNVNQVVSRVRRLLVDARRRDGDS